MYANYIATIWRVSIKWQTLIFFFYVLGVSNGYLYRFDFIFIYSVISSLSRDSIRIILSRWLRQDCRIFCIYPNYSDTLSPNDTCSKIYNLLMCEKTAGKVANHIDLVQNFKHCIFGIWFGSILFAPVCLNTYGKYATCFSGCRLRKKIFDIILCTHSHSSNWKKYWYFSYFSMKIYVVIIIRSTSLRCF